MALADMKLTDYINNKPYECSCGKTHRADIDEILIENGAVNETGAVAERVITKNAPAFDKAVHSVFLLADENTYAAVGKKAEESARARGFKINRLILPGDRQVVPDEKTVFKVLHAIDSRDKFFIAAGSGTLNDMCRYLSFKLSVPYMVVASAPSMDGFASNVAPLVVCNIKTTYITITPRAIIGDTEVLKKAPRELIAAGLGDILGKYNALCDWKNSNLVTGEEYCAEIAGMVMEATKKTERSAPGLAGRDEGSIKLLMEALVLTGVAMSFWGYSRPASSAEHHIAHFWEMAFLYENREAVLHGAKVGVASVYAAYLQNKLANAEIDFGRAEASAKNFSFDKWADKTREQYREVALEFIDREREIKMYAPENRLKRIEAIKANLPEIIATIKKYTPPEDKLRALIREAGGPASPAEVGIPDKLVLDGVRYAKDSRIYYTILQILGDLDLLDEYAKIL